MKDQQQYLKSDQKSISLYHRGEEPSGQDAIENNQDTNDKQKYAFDDFTFSSCSSSSVQKEGTYSIMMQSLKLQKEKEDDGKSSDK